MNNNARNLLAYHGLELLKDAVLIVLYETERPYLRYKDIYEALGLPRIRKVGETNVSDDFIHGVLLRLWEAGLVKVVGNRAEFKITEKGIKAIEGKNFS